MKSLLIPLAALCAATLLPADDKGEKRKSDHDLIQGTWKIVEFQEAGKVAKAYPPFHSFQLTADWLLLNAKDAKGKEVVVYGFMYKLDASKRPKTMDTTHELEKGKPIVQRAIYALDGDELKLSMASAGKPYPTKLESKAGDDWISFVLKRDKKDKK
jgi:uncharacterized protein (TIGR03067 family)